PHPAHFEGLSCRQCLGSDQGCALQLPSHIRSDAWIGKLTRLRSKYGPPSPYSLQFPTVRGRTDFVSAIAPDESPATCQLDKWGNSWKDLLNGRSKVDEVIRRRQVIGDARLGAGSYRQRETDARLSNDPYSGRPVSLSKILEPGNGRQLDFG